MDDLSVCQSVGRSVRTYVGLSSALWKNGTSDPDAVWNHRSDGSRDNAGGGLWGLAHGKGYFWGANLGRAIVTNGDFTAYVCDSTSTVGAAVWGGACSGPRHCCIRWGPHRAKGRGGFGGFCSPFSQWEMTLGRRR